MTPHRLDRRARRADDRRLAPQRRAARRTRVRRPTTTPTTCSCARSSASRARCTVELVCEPRFDYGATPPAGPCGGEDFDIADATDGTTTFRLFSDLRLGVEGGRVRARHTCARASAASARSRGPRRSAGRAPPSRPTSTSRARRTSGATGSPAARSPTTRCAATSSARRSCSRASPTGRPARSSRRRRPRCPRRRGGERNWDYRYCWMRDATFTLWGLHALGLDWEADDFLEYVADLERNEDGSLQIMYGILGQRELDEQTLDHLKGYEGARPVRIGNARLDPAPERRLRRRARLRLPARQAARPPLRAALAGALRPGRVRGEASGRSPTRASGRRAASPSTTSRPS